MDETMLEIIKDGITIVSPVIQNCITALITTVFLRKNTSIEELEKLKANKFGEVVSDLLENDKMTYLEYYKCRNFLKVAKLADQASQSRARKKSSKQETQFDFDWFMRFFDAVGNISNEDLQMLWGKILANEMERPKTCSLRTLDMIRNMSPEEANTFTILCKYIMESGSSYFIYPTGFYDEHEGYAACTSVLSEAGINYANSIMPMLEAGILTGDHDLAIYLEKGKNLGVHNENILCLIEYQGEDTKLFKQEAYFLTTNGVELYNIVRNMSDYESDTEYAIQCFKQMKEENQDMKIAAYRRLEVEPYFDFTDILAE